MDRILEIITCWFQNQKMTDVCLVHKSFLMFRHKILYVRLNLTLNLETFEKIDESENQFSKKTVEITICEMCATKSQREKTSTIIMILIRIGQIYARLRYVRWSQTLPKYGGDLQPKLQNFTHTHHKSDQ